MKVSNQAAPNIQPKAKEIASKKEAPQKNVNAPVDKVKVHTQVAKVFKVSENNPSDPTVSTKVLDGLHSGMINFSQEQRDVLATIMSDRAKVAVKEIEGGVKE